MSEDLQNIAKKIVNNGKGILAADESTNTIKKRFESINVESNEKTRSSYRDMLFSTPEISKYISGVILFEETFFQKNEDGESLKDKLQNIDCCPGIKIDQGLEEISKDSIETFTNGIETLNDRIKPFVENGAKFTKWRAVINIGENMPSADCIKKNSYLLSEYALISQNNGLVPIVEPEVIMEGSHSLDECYEVTKETLNRVFNDLKKKEINLKGMLLKPNMVVPGSKSGIDLNTKEIAEKTLKCLKETVPNEVTGIVFLSGGLSSLNATMILNEINKLNDAPWNLSFSYGRALQEDALKAWAGKNENKNKVQEIFLHRAKMNSLACNGKWETSLENE
ncbi:MAG: Fructose-bisphosphate aldolase class 1 [Alphaproteobacteria bacterium MarineAlpha6_Bin4]|nr:MAG: Fructose-bisphosphate aldolase class 1 [Alphaproteobacteria bacterium MarineAlpha6_Bin3]PPR38029.1 MAG: Fructose-bisphosphate aldolase class 1 [Alphaproteobacteria bacterium MarineAlpha6_Bin4]|tara:strand:+ start:9211 stop:10224 length:1014 start_codon:yes stop_codon:yes gene_type:complete